MLIFEPYKSELVSLWRFKTPEIARESSAAIFLKFESYLASDDFVGADMARKFLQMGFTRARRFANYKGGKKYEGADHQLLERGTGDPSKAISADTFTANGNWPRPIKHMLLRRLIGKRLKAKP